MSNKEVFTAQVVANATVQTSTTPSATVTSQASASATSTKSYDDAYQKAQDIAQNIANSNAQNDANLITQSANLTQQVIQSSYIPLLPTGSTGTFLLNDSNGNTYDDPSLLSFNYNKILTTGSGPGNNYRNIIVGGNLIPGDSFNPLDTGGFKGPYSLGNAQNKWNQIWLEGGTIYLSGLGSTEYVTTGAVSYGTPPYPWGVDYGKGIPNAFILQNYQSDTSSGSIAEFNPVGPGSAANGLIIGGGNIYFYTPTGATAPDGGKTGAIIPLINETLLPAYAANLGSGYYAMPTYGVKIGSNVTITNAGAITAQSFNGAGITSQTFNGATINNDGAISTQQNITSVGGSISVETASGTVNASINSAGTVTAKNISTSGSITVQNGSTVYASIGSTGAVSAVSFNAGSDHRIKKHVTSLDDTFKVDYLNPVTYINTRTNKKDIGLIAHELQEHYPELVTGEKDGEEMQTVNYNGLVPILINEIKTIKNNIVKLENRISELEK
jgi:hypothetical protein